MHHITLQLEPLEDRQLLSAAPNDAFVAALYHGLLKRAADDAGKTYWVGQMNAGVSQDQVAQGIVASDEFRTHQIDDVFQAALGRGVDDKGRDFWLSTLKAGATMDQVRVGIAASDEFFAKAGGTNAKFLETLYQTELHRGLDDAGRSEWGNALAAGAGRSAVTLQVLASPEAGDDRVRGLFKDVLGRDADDAGEHFWSDRRHQSGDDAVVTGLAVSDEFFEHESGGHGGGGGGGGH